MATSTAARFSYQRLKNEGGLDEHDEYQEEIERAILHVRARSWPTKFRRSSSRMVHIRKRLKVKIPSLKRFLRRKIRPVMLSWAKALKRLKDSQAHFGDLFAGNYLFMQVNPTPKPTLKMKMMHSSYPYPYPHPHPHQSSQISECQGYYYS